MRVSAVCVAHGRLWCVGDVTKLIGAGWCRTFSLCWWWWQLLYNMLYAGLPGGTQDEQACRAAWLAAAAITAGSKENWPGPSALALCALLLPLDLEEGGGTCTKSNVTTSSMFTS